jgi:FkbM family methyltransferase
VPPLLKKWRQSRTWRKQAQLRAKRKHAMMSLGANACGVLANTKQGLYVVDPEDGYISWDLLHQGFYNEPERALLQSFVTNESDVLVVGAHIGAHAVPLSKLCRSLTAIEANPHTFRYLLVNLRLNDCRNTTTYNIAAGDKLEKIKFIASRDNSGGSKRMPVRNQSDYMYDDPDVIEVESAPLDTLLADGAFDLVIMDIEGSECAACRGMQRILRNAGSLAVEFLPHHIMDVADVTVEEFAEPILPNFEWLFVPAHDQLVAKHDMLAKLRSLHAADEKHDTIIFMKQPPTWMRLRFLSGR